MLPPKPRKATLRAACLGVAAFCALAVAAEQSEPAGLQEGVHYTKLPIPVETRDAARIEVLEVFSYACIHCYRLEPLLEAWRQDLPADVDFHRLPLVVPRLLPLVQAFYAAEALDVQERVHLPIFQAIHDHGIDMNNPRYLRRLFEREAGVEEERFQTVFNSFGVRGRVNQADAQGRMYRIMGTPALVVEGRYLVEAGTGPMENMLTVVDQLVAQERQSRLEPQPPAAPTEQAEQPP